ncbi:THAP domain containing 6 [Plakobranchus ocellatus]|uniref:THAP domain containing 6 n=1 Tax=Plakobranchus ocellatus TaxID=259542 RepID=A0AAV3Z1N2_9GAST|nr:THAP domain containing 6 [Plakobranchus ocellatus]
MLVGDKEGGNFFWSRTDTVRLISRTENRTMENPFKGDERKYHMFPRDPTRRKQWAAALKREGFVATEYSRICSDHFTKESYNGSGRLNCSAVPIVFNFPDHPRR